MDEILVHPGEGRENETPKTFNIRVLIPRFLKKGVFVKHCPPAATKSKQTDGRTDAGASDPYVPICFSGDTKSYFYSSCKETAENNIR